MKRKAGYEYRQVIVSTHSEEMLRDLSIDATEALRIEPSPEGSVLLAPNQKDRQALAAGLSVADVLLPRTAPRQLTLTFEA